MLVPQLSILLGVTVALLFGCADVTVSLTARSLPVLRIAFLSHVCSVVALVLLVMLAWPHLGPPRPVGWMNHLAGGIVLGVLAAGGYLALYRGLSLGPIALVSPISSSNTALASVLAIGLLHEYLGGWQVFWLALLVVGVGLASLHPRALAGARLGTLISQAGVRWALVAVVLLGLLNFCLGAEALAWGWFMPVCFMRLFTAIFLGMMDVWTCWQGDASALLVSPGPGAKAARAAGASWRLWVQVPLIGVLDTGGLFAYSWAGQLHATSMAAALSSGYALIPLLFAMVYLREQPARSQLLGVLLVIISLAALPLL